MPLPNWRPSTSSITVLMAPSSNCRTPRIASFIWVISDQHQLFRMTGGKTAALVEAALRVGALLGTPDARRVDALARFGEAFGLAFQARDDFLGIWGEPELTGKPVGSDILQGKRSLPIVHALEKAAAEKVMIFSRAFPRVDCPESPCRLPATRASIAIATPRRRR